MSEDPWLTIIGVGEDGPDGLSTASRAALKSAEIIMGPPRHLALLPCATATRIAWPVPFSEGIERLLDLRGRRVAVLASGDPFWFGAGTVLATRLSVGEWRALPGRSTFSLAAAQLGWGLETTICLGLHATPLSRLRPHLSPGQRIIALLRDGQAVRDLADYLRMQGFGTSALTVMQALGGPAQAVTRAQADTLPDRDFGHPLCVAIHVAGDGASLPLASGRNDTWFDHDGQITKRPIRALTLSALAPRAGQHLWDIGGGSGSVAIEWLMSDSSLRATSIEPRPDRAERIAANAARLGMDRLNVVTGHAPAVLRDLDRPDAVFIGGGLSDPLLDWLGTHLPPGTRIVANAVTLESEAMLTQTHARLGGDLLRIEMAVATPIGSRRGWKASYPITQWSHVL